MKLLNKVVNKFGRTGLKLKKYSPEILVGVGLVSMAASVVLAHQAQPKSKLVIAETEDLLDSVDQALALDNEEKYSVLDARKDKALIYSKTAINMAKVYAPAVATFAFGTACILYSFGIIKKRNLALIGAFGALEKSYTEYRERVVAKHGEEADRLFKNGTTQTKVEKVDIAPDGKKTKSSEIVEATDPSGLSIYAKFFDESCINWSKTPGYNFAYLKGQQDYCNDLVMARGHLFLNEVYDMLGLPRTQEGSIVGWVKNSDGDGYVDFGIFEADSERARAFVNGYERNILLDFNVDGVIWDKI